MLLQVNKGQTVVEQRPLAGVGGGWGGEHVLTARVSLAFSFVVCVGMGRFGAIGLVGLGVLGPKLGLYTHYPK
ncbi:hypothetical protein ES319_A13G102600v1 [Gossypium barbadense]|uniref:Uncharacterized protein n=2 Tax=Gossypium TaxID=3633 RepID=A0A5J5SXQ5_GOSBA|nr:hypothetical protein ES319_A13G102600v1 [Gossypium barbadense]TYG86094.1 hypothetical protein ES288_A13G108300v1 [Gossypium darwinii]